MPSTPPQRFYDGLWTQLVLRGFRLMSPPSKSAAKLSAWDFVSRLYVELEAPGVTQIKDIPTYNRLTHSPGPPSRA